MTERLTTAPYPPGLLVLLLTTGMRDYDEQPVVTLFFCNQIIATTNVVITQPKPVGSDSDWYRC